MDVNLDEFHEKPDKIKALLKKTVQKASESPSKFHKTSVWQGFSEKNQGFSENNQRFSEKNQENQGFSEKNQGFSQKNQDFSEKNEDFSQKNQDFSEKTKGLMNKSVIGLQKKRDLARKSLKSADWNGFFKT